jgi:limonene-1,2-epoxide hydrolase
VPPTHAAEGKPSIAPEEEFVSENVRIVQEFIAAWNANDIESVMGLLAPDCLYHNMPVAPVRGTEAIRGVIQGFAGAATAIDWRLHRVAEAVDGTVLTERTDRFEMGGKWVELPVMGAFAVKDGKITAWRDYFDLQQFTRQLPGAAGSEG